MNDKHIGLGLIFTSAMVYIGHYILVGWYASTLTTLLATSRMRKAVETIGNEPKYVAIIIFVFGLFYIIRAEFREHRSRMAQVHSLAKANADMHQMKNEKLEKDTLEALTLLKCGKTDEAKAIVDRILKS
jgi:hypothetical protein